jgi:WhiB family redox-sensing transcriptional regulator
MKDWRHDSTCRNEDPELFFPTGRSGSVTYDVQVIQAKAVCGRCPVVTACLEWALTNSRDDGIWGGMDPTERRTLKRRRVVAHTA